MKRTINILILIIIYLVCCARSCTDDGNTQELREEKLLTSSIDSVKKAFEVFSPGDQLLRTYERTAKQKLNDFADYLKIASDSSIDKTFRQQAAKMAGKLFISRGVEISNWNKVHAGTDLKTIEQLLGKSVSHGISYWIKPCQIKVNKSFTMKNDTTYTGSLSFYQQLISYDNQSTPENITGMLVIDIYAIKRVKSFGKENFSIWEVYLGDIKTLQKS